jgi:error-prone DNA polymerase
MTDRDCDYIELRCRSAFSFLDGAALPEELVAAAAGLGYRALALADRDGVYGAPRFFAAAARLAEQAAPDHAPTGAARRDEATLAAWVARWPLRPILGALLSTEQERELLVLVESREGYRNLCRLLTAARLNPNTEQKKDRGKIIPQISLSSIGEYSKGLIALIGGDARDPVTAALTDGEEAARRAIDSIVDVLGGRNVYVEVQRHDDADEELRNLRLLSLATRHRLPVVATNDVRYVTPGDRRLHDVLTCIRHSATVDEIGRRLPHSAERWLKPPAEMARRFADLPGAVRRTREVADRCAFTLANLGYRFPDYPVPRGRSSECPASYAHPPTTSSEAGHSEDRPPSRLSPSVDSPFENDAKFKAMAAGLDPRSVDDPRPRHDWVDHSKCQSIESSEDAQQAYLEQVTWAGVANRFDNHPSNAFVAQVRRELALIGKLKLAGYFLIVWDIVEHCRRQDILVQGRGSAANSAVCYALGITAVDPVRMGLLFERFLSEERGEWPDIDLDLPSGDEREEAIQYVYRTYGRHACAMTANVITYRAKMAVRDVGRALGFSEEQLALMSRALTRFEFPDPQWGIRQQLQQEAGFSVEDERVRLLVELASRLLGLPRHLGQHSGGMVLAHGRLDEIVPLEPASMPGRVVVQWDKDDCADLGLVKVDLLGLGMMAALEECVALVEKHEGVRVDLAHLDHEDPAVYQLLQKADTVGVFQVESRAQMATLPRMRPERFYDLVIEVAIIRPGPIVGDMLHPYLRRRAGREAPDPLHPCLESVLARTLGVPLFQEQLMRMAMVAAGFSGGQAEELRRAMGFKRSVERMGTIEAALRAGMARNGIDAAAQERIVKSITSFALYGFPESHAASFALIAYASAWLKVHHPAAFYAALLDNWPMGFYHPATLVRDAMHRGVEVRPIDVTASEWDCTLEPSAVDGPALRIGLRYVRGLREEVGRRIAAAHAERPLSSAADLAARAGVPQRSLATLAEVGALAGLGLERRAALWQVEAIGRSGEMFVGHPTNIGSDEDAALDEMSEREELAADFRGAGLTTGRHPMALRRATLERVGVLPAERLADTEGGRRVRVAGHVITRQRPGTAKGFFFLTLEDETGLANAVVTPAHFAARRPLLVGAPALVVEGVLQKVDGTITLRADRFWPLDEVATPSHDFR